MTEQHQQPTQAEIIEKLVAACYEVMAAMDSVWEMWFYEDDDDENVVRDVGKKVQESKQLATAAIEVARSAMVPEVVDRHSGDCTYHAIPDSDPLNGICICGYGLRMMRKCNYDHLVSKDHPSNTQDVSADPKGTND